MKERITITIEKEFLEWLDKKSELKIFANRSHGFEFLIKSAQLKEADVSEKEGA
jgi:metal-responsive CopG/Arc/MetJ family transcriptional regulator